MEDNLNLRKNEKQRKNEKSYESYQKLQNLCNALKKGNSPHNILYCDSGYNSFSQIKNRLDEIVFIKDDSKTFVRKGKSSQTVSFKNSVPIQKFSCVTVHINDEFIDDLKNNLEHEKFHEMKKKKFR